ncbi:MAG: hypothetical protein CM15mP25_3120 [Gammaproteobacteria bacterium]|nr:MAG: hypothetical protein CM15mP25_3120 [Gammaproteobacteria bacterium]
MICIPCPEIPLRARELDIDLNDNPNLAIFRQSDNGVLGALALFALILDWPIRWISTRRP